MTRREAVLRLREWYKAFANFGKGNERTVKEFLEIEDLIHSMDAELTLVKKERDDLRKGMEAATSLLDEYAQTFSRWISVEEMLPEKGQKVAFIPSCNHGSVYVGVLSNIGKSGSVMFSHRQGRYKSNYYAKYWIPLPELPKGE